MERKTADFFHHSVYQQVTLQSTTEKNKLNYYLSWNKLLAPCSKRRAGALFRAEQCALV